MVPPTDASPYSALKHLQIEQVLLPLLWQMAIIIVAARAVAAVGRRFGQPSAVGELTAGLLMGPSVLGAIAPRAFEAIFHPRLQGVPFEVSDGILHWTLVSLSQVGLILLLFLIGLEFDFGHLRFHGRSALAISWSGILIPFSLGGSLAWFMKSTVGAADPLSFSLFLGMALSITAIPVLGRIMMELNITRSRIGAITISAAAVDDACGWILLATVAAVARSRLSGANDVGWGTAAKMAVETVAFAVGMIFILRPWLCRWARRTVRTGDLSSISLAAVLALIFCCAIVTNLIGIFAIFGAFTLGAVLSSEREFSEAVNRKLRDFVTVFFLPLYFAYTGLRTNIGSLESGTLWGWCAIVLAAAVVGKLGGCGLAAWWTGASRREAACVGVMMNTRGLMELIVVNLGKDLGVIPDSVYCMLVIMALVTTVMTTPHLLWTSRGTELEPLIRESEFRGFAPQPVAAAAVALNQDPPAAN